jgi:adenosine deaminase
MSFEAFVRAMPKVELHVHLEGAIQRETLLLLAQRNQVALPVDTVAGLREWYTFTDFDHFIEIYSAICACICTPGDIELIAREFLRGQAVQQIRYSEVIFTPYAHYDSDHPIPFADQLAALNRAQEWAATEFGIRVGWVPDFGRNTPIEQGMAVADWAIRGKEQGIIALGIGGPEMGYPAERFQAVFDHARAGGLASLPHAGETVGPESIWGALRVLHANRIGHGVRCLEDPTLVDLLRERQIPLDVSPTSNVCLGVAPSLAEHPLPRLLAEGLYVTINSDDPPMFNTTLTNEFLQIAHTFGFGLEVIKQLVLNSVRASLLPPAEREKMEGQFRVEFGQLHNELRL